MSFGLIRMDGERALHNFLMKPIHNNLPEGLDKVIMVMQLIVVCFWVGFVKGCGKKGTKTVSVKFGHLYELA